MSEPRYETAYALGQRIGHTDSVVCTDCGVFVMNVAAHDRYHSIQSSWAWMLAVLKTAHVAAHIHDKYDVVERIDSRKFDNWSADALAEVIGDNPEG
jgi:predicted Rossmann-fold nucleotide-binding protein